MAYGFKQFWDDWGPFGLFNQIGKLWNGLTGETSAQATKEANERNIQNQNYWNEIQMQREDTAHQREVADLQAAGLNPWLSVGGGAQTANLQTAQVQPEDGSEILQKTVAITLLLMTKGLIGKAGAAAATKNFWKSSMLGYK